MNEVVSTLLKYTIAGAANGFFFTVGSLAAKELAKKTGLYEDADEKPAEPAKPPAGPVL